MQKLRGYVRQETYFFIASCEGGGTELLHPLPLTHPQLCGHIISEVQFGMLSISRGSDTQREIATRLTLLRVSQLASVGTTAVQM